MKRVLFGSVLWLCVSQAASAATLAPDGPFALSFDPQGSGGGMAGKTISGYDAKLPGYHVQGEIATLIVSPRAGWKTAKNAPGTLVLAIRTSSAGRPMLEGFSLIASGVTIKTSLTPGMTTEEVEVTGASPGGRSISVPKGTYFRMAMVGGEAHVMFLPKAMALLAKKCRVEWVDWYRG